jgi:hypothetical protein
MQFAVAQIAASVQHLCDRTFFVAWVFGNRIFTPLFTKGVVMASRTENIGLRLSKEERALVAQAAKDRGYLSASALMRAAIRNELSGRENEICEADAGLRRVWTVCQATEAVLPSL